MLLEVDVGHTEGDHFPRGDRDGPDALSLVGIGVGVVGGDEHPIVRCETLPAPCWVGGGGWTEIERGRFIKQLTV